METKEINRIGHVININSKNWRVAQKTFRYGREWQYTLSHETVEGTYESMSLNENALEQIIKSGSKRIDIDE
jgi:5-methylcytosine-specific restriction endonuclease McrBC GTP-binding regulatory subunit McrB